MNKNHFIKRGRRAPKTILRLPDLDHAKAGVLNSLTCPDAQRGYGHAIDEFVDWYCSEPRLAFNRTVCSGIVLTWNPGTQRPEPSTCGSGPYVGWPMRRRTAVS